MKKFLPLIILLFLILSCNNDDDQIHIEEQSNGFFINSDFYVVNKAYYVPDLTTEEFDDFFIVITDGEIISPLSDSNDFEFSEKTTNSVIFRGVPNPKPNEATTVNFAPSGSYMFNSNYRSFSFAQFKFDCEPSNGVLKMCQYAIIIDEPINPDVAVIDLEIEEISAVNDINFHIELENSIIIQGHFRGVLERLGSQ